jgi:hypothetical protein
MATSQTQAGFLPPKRIPQFWLRVIVGRGPSPTDMSMLGAEQDDNIATASIRKIRPFTDSG